MSYVSRDEGGRSRRRRRGRPSSSSSQSTNNTSNVSHPRSTSSIPPNSSSYNRRTNHPSNRSTNYHQQQQQQRQREEEEELQRRKEQEEKERIELEIRKAGEAQQEKLRQQRLEHAQKRFQQRKLNLSYIPSSSGEPPATERLSDSQLRQLDSSLRKCTGFIRKIRSSGITEDSAKTLITEARSLNLSRYISEVITAILEAKIRSADVDHVLLLCGELHRLYEDFSQQFATTLSNIVINPTSHATQRDLITRKSAIRILIEMNLLGMITDVSLLLSALKQLVRGSKDKKEEGTNNLTIIVTFIRAGSRALLPHVTPLVSSTDTPSQKNSLTEIEEYSWEDDIISDSTKNAISSALQSYYTLEITEMLKDAATSLESATTNVNRSTQLRGTPDEAVSNAFESAKQHYEKVLSSAKIVADALAVPPFEPEVITTPKSFGSTENYAADSPQVLIGNPFSQSTKNKNTNGDTDQISDSELPFESEEQRLFYNELLNFSDETNKNGTRNGNSSKSIDGVKEGSRASSAGDTSRPTRGGSASKQASDGRRRGPEKGMSLDKLLGRLPSIESKENADLFVQNFIVATEGSKNGTKKFIKSLCTVPPQKLNLLPAYARMAANLQTRFPDIPSTVAANLEEEFRFLVGKSDVDEKNLAVCTKTARYIGEYVKFSLIETATMFDLMALCMKDFTAHRVDAICHMLESCGRYVFRTASSHIRMSNILETIQRIKSVRNLEARHNALVDTAYYATKGSMGNKIQKKTRPPIHEYIRHLIYYRLNASNIRWTHQQLLKLPWNEELEHYIIKKFVKISRARFSTIPYASTLIANLEKHKPALVIGIVDALLEAIRSGMEKNDGRDSQRRIAEIHLLGEMHKCGVVDEKLIYNVLYQIITIGKDTPELEQYAKNDPQVSGSSLNDQQSVDSQLSRSMFSSAQVLDPPRDFFRVHLVCELMESCGRVLVALNRRKLEVFWVFFERYLFFKASQAGSADNIPLSVNHVVSDVFEHVLMKPRRNFRESRHASRSEGYSYRHRESSTNTESTAGTVTFSRCRSLKEALEAVNGIENHPSDASLVSIPVREVINSGSLDAAGTQKGQVSRNPNVTDSNGTESSQSTMLNSQNNNEKEEMNTNEQDSSNNDSYSNGSGEDREAADEDSFSGEDQDEEDQLPNGIHDKSVSMDSEDEIGDNNDEDDDDLDEDEEIDEEDDDDEGIMVDSPTQQPRTEEEEAFAKELAAFTAESVQSARANSSRVTKFDRMTIPMSLMTQKMEEEKAAAAAQAAKSLNDVDSESDSDPGTRKKKSQPERSVEFKMLLRKGGKSQLHGLHVPETSSLAVAAKESETADAARHEETKRLVLRSRTVLNDDTDDLEDEVPLRAEQHARERDENIRKQRSQDQAELLSTLFRPRSRR